MAFTDFLDCINPVGVMGRVLSGAHPSCRQGGAAPLEESSAPPRVLSYMTKFKKKLIPL